MLRICTSAASRLLIARSISDPFRNSLNHWFGSRSSFLAACLAASMWSGNGLPQSCGVNTQAQSDSSSSARVRVPSRQATLTGPELGRSPSRRPHRRAQVSSERSS
jgi:hypothetical protein